MAKVTIPHPGWRQFAGRRPIAAGGIASPRAVRLLLRVKAGRPLVRVTRLEDASGPAPWRRRLGLLEGQCSVFHPVPDAATIHLIVDLVDLRLEAGLGKTLAVWADGTVACHVQWAVAVPTVYPKNSCN